MYDQYTDSEEVDQSKSISIPSTSKASSVRSNKQRRRSIQNVENVLQSSEKKDENPIKNIETTSIKQIEEKSDHPINVQVEDITQKIKKSERTKSTENSPKQISPKRKETSKTQQIKKKEKQIEENKQNVEAKQENKNLNDFYSLPNEFAIEQSDHYSLTCHLFPRLSESNLQFHDIYWDKTEKVM
uniref:Ig-like domain-containing protein n=1 Tax=Meloidogyne hapla TaxID=6305 RepID=A0A1I8BYS5_MELHA